LCWRDRCLIEIENDRFVPVWTYYTSTAWNSLNDSEKEKLKSLISQTEYKQDKLWETQSDEILSTLTKSVDMIPCGEDLGANLPCLPHIMTKNNILALRVMRWTRNWELPGKPYVPLKDITYLSVATTSVHDSPTVRQWWHDDREGSSLFVRTNPWAFGIEGWDTEKMERIANSDFSPEIAENYLKAVARANSVWCIHPLQDFIAMNKNYWLQNPSNEQINIPGSVNEFNWTYRIPVSVETLEKDSDLIGKINEIVKLHE